MLRIKYIFVGKIKTPYWCQAATHYDSRIKRWYKCQEVTIKDGTGRDRGEKKEREARAILKKITPKDLVVCLDEHGQTMTSTIFSSHLQKWFENPAKSPCFVIGGPYGLSGQVLERADLRLGFGPMTFPHELARVMLLEQIYRAGSILKNLPYHHD
ncbi:23S rRNA (pseudouridine(1915)-N(3))-methyltransferase RlmH [Desulfoplanes sp.]